MMKRAAGVALLAAFAGGCVTVPRDAGLSDVQRSIEERGVRNASLAASPASLDGELTGDEAVRIAMASSARLQASLAELGIARADLMEASTVSNPVFEFELRFPGEPYHPYEFRIAQSLIELVQLPRRRALGRAAFDAARMRVSAEVLRFAGDVRASYYEALAAAKHAELSETHAAAAQAAVDVALRQHQAGNITDLDLENEQARYEQAKLDLARAAQRLLLSRESLTRAMGLREIPDTWKLPSQFPPLPQAESSQQELEELAAKQRLDLAIAQREMEIAQRRVPLTRLAILEETVLDVHYEREPEGKHTVGPGIELPIPIFNTGRAGRTRAEAEFLRARHTLDALTAETSSQLRSGRAAVSEARARVEYYRDVVLPRRRRIVELTQLEHNAMLTGVFALLQARQNELQAQRELVEAQREYWSARTGLDRALQGIASSDTSSSSPANAQGRGVETRGGH